MNNSDWTQGEKGLSKKFNFTNFNEGLAFVNKVAELAEKENHHPDICLHSYNKVTINLFTHDANKITEKDIRLANLINNLR